MPLELTNTLSLDNISLVSNFTEFPQFLINVNEYMYGGYLYFILFITMWIVGILILQTQQKQLLNNAFISSGVSSITVFVARAIEYTVDGRTLYLLTDYQMWVFALITILSGAILWATKEKGS